MRAQLFGRGAAVLLIVVLLMLPIASAQGTVTIFGTNASNAQSNITKSGNQSVNVSIWNIDSGIKTFTINVTNITDTFTVTIHNITIGRVVELRFNATSVNGYQADSTGTITFTQIQTTGNRTYDIRPAVNVAGYNFTWAQFWTYPFIMGTNLSTIITNTILNATSTVQYFNGDGITMNFTTSSAMQTTTSRVYINGIRQRQGATGSYIEHPTFIEFASAPPLYDLIEVEYV